MTGGASCGMRALTEGQAKIAPAAPSATPSNTPITNTDIRPSVGWRVRVRVYAVSSKADPSGTRAAPPGEVGKNTIRGGGRKAGRHRREFAPDARDPCASSGGGDGRWFPGRRRGRIMTVSKSEGRHAVALRGRSPRRRDPRGRRGHDPRRQPGVPRAVCARSGELRLGDGALPLVSRGAGDGGRGAQPRSRGAPDAERREDADKVATTHRAAEVGRAD